MTVSSDSDVPGEGPDASAGPVVTVTIPETREALGSSLAVPNGAWRERVEYLVPHAWSGAGSGREGIVEECRSVWERWSGALMERTPFLNWTSGGFGPADVAYTEETGPDGERTFRCTVALRCWVAYDGRRDGLGGPRSQIGPALTPEDWQSYAPLDRTLAHHAPARMHDNAHGAAALALHGQPYGFTWNDYEVILDTSNELEHDYDGPFMSTEQQHQVDTLRSAAARIAALLPPRDDPDPAAPF